MSAFPKMNLASVTTSAPHGIADTTTIQLSSLCLVMAAVVIVVACVIVVMLDVI
jgi:hypothetical protein